MNKTYDIMMENPHYFLLGAYTESNRTVMGLLCYDLVYECQPIMFMENMVMDKNFQNIVIGKQLLTKLEEISKEHNCLFIEICSSMFRRDAHSFYESMGYKNDEVQGYRKFFRDINLSKKNLINRKIIIFPKENREYFYEQYRFD